MRPIALLPAALASLCALAPAAAAAGAAAGPRVSTMIVGKSRTLVSARTVSAGAVTVTASGRRCAVAPGTPLGALVATRAVSFGVRDQGACSARPADSSALYVFRIGPDTARGQDGWVYKVDGRAGTTSAADASGAFGNGRRLRAGQQVLWFWCRMGADGCQRTLELRPVTGGVKVVSLDDQAKARAVAGATVRAGSATLRTDAAGFAAVSTPGRVTATAPGLVPAFPLRLP